VGLLVGFFLSVASPGDARYELSSAMGFLGLLCAGLGVLAGGVIAVLLDKRP
jgi:acyl-coenzyme A thioesterase PaaI-like protein